MADALRNEPWRQGMAGGKLLFMAEKGVDGVVRGWQNAAPMQDARHRTRACRRGGSVKGRYGKSGLVWRLTQSV